MSDNLYLTQNSPEMLRRRAAYEDAVARGKRFAEVTHVEFRRIVLHVEGVLRGFSQEELSGLWARFVTKDRLLKFNVQHFDLEGDRFHLTANMMSVNNEAPPLTGEYQLRIFQRYEGMNKREVSSPHHDYIMVGDALMKKSYNDEGQLVKKVVLTHEYPALLSPEMKEACTVLPEDKKSFRVKRGAHNLFYADSATDMDSEEYGLNINYKPPGPPMTWPRRTAAVLHRRKELIIRDLYWGKIWLFTHTFKLFKKLFRRKGNTILFCSGSRAKIGGNEEVIRDRMVERGLDKSFHFTYDFKANITVKRSPWKMLRFLKKLAAADIILVDDYYPDIYHLDFDKDVKILQVWHACGAFKAVGFERLGKQGAPAFNTRVHKCYTHVPVSSYHSAMHNAEGFALDESKFYPTGIPRTDIFFDEDHKARTRAAMLRVFPQCKAAKKVYMYAPTFRGNNAVTAYFPMDRFDLYRIGKFLKDEGSVMIIKMHPFVKRPMEIPEEYADVILDASGYREVNDILFIIDVLITDYSSIIYETSLLNVPMLFYAFDQRYYEATRDFFESYETLVPGKICNSFDQLMDALEAQDYEAWKLPGFVKKNFTYTDGKSTDRVIDQLILGE